MLFKFLLASAAASLLAAAPAGAASPSVVYEKLTGGLHTIDSSGAGNRQIVRDANQPEWSPDGRRVLYAGDYGHRGLWTARADGSDRRQVVRPGARPIAGRRSYITIAPTWAPDGKRVAFVAVWEVPRPGADDGQVDTISKVVTTGVRGGTLRVLGDGASPTWSPDGRRVAFTQPVGDKGTRIVTVGAAGGGRRVLVPAEGTYRSNLDYSADGRRLLYLSNSRIRMLDLRTRRTTRVPERVAKSVIDATWTPDGRVAYLRNERKGADGRTPPTSVYTIRHDGTGNRRAFRLPLDERNGFWASALSWRP
jgi:Tol biopolymer transport system component